MLPAAGFTSLRSGLTSFTGLTLSGALHEHGGHSSFMPTATVNLPTPPHPEPLPHVDASIAKLRAWQELQQQMEDLHARLQYLRLLLKLGVGGG